MSLRIGPGGIIHETDHWIVDHCFGPLGVGTLIVKPKRDVRSVADLNNDEAGELGDLLHRTAQIVRDLVKPDQVYVCLWSHMNREPVHIHFVVQPITKELMTQYDAHGPRLQAALFAAGDLPDDEEAAAFAAAARAAW